MGAVAAWGLALVLMCGPWWTGVRAAGTPKEDTLKQALSDMSGARRALAERGAAAAELRGRLHDRCEGLRAEIAQERQTHAITSFLQAARVERIGYNLRLVQRIYGYLERIDRRIEVFQAADHALAYAMRRARDDLLMVKILADTDSSGLLRQIESVLNEAARETGKPLFNASEPPSRTLESVWIELSRTP
jgi:hypothetical protein